MREGAREWEREKGEERREKREEKTTITTAEGHKWKMHTLKDERTQHACHWTATRGHILLQYIMPPPPESAARRKFKKSGSRNMVGKLERPRTESGKGLRQLTLVLCCCITISVSCNRSANPFHTLPNKVDNDIKKRKTKHEKKEKKKGIDNNSFQNE